MAELLNREARIFNKTYRVEIVIYGDGIEDVLAAENERLSADGHEPVITRGNGAAQLTYFVNRASKPETYPFKGEQLTLPKIAERIGIAVGCLYQRLYRMTLSEAIAMKYSTPEENRARFVRLMSGAAKDAE